MDGVMGWPDADRPLRHRMSKGDVLAFIHIPKTGGTSVFSLLAERFPMEQVLSVDDGRGEEFWGGLSDDKLRQCRLIRASLGYSIYRRLPRKPIFLTMLRDPVQRTISEYQHIRRVPHHRLHERFRAEGTGLAEYLQDSRYRDQVENIQVRRLVGGRDRPSSHLSPADQLTIARYRLAEFLFFGLAEHMDESIDLLAYTLGWDPWEAAPKLNWSERGERVWDVDEGTRRLVEARNDLDLELYDHAREIFHERRRRMVKELTSLAARLDWGGAAEALWVSPPSPTVPPSGPGPWLSRWVFKPLGRVRRRLIPVGARGETTYLRVRRSLLGW